MANSEAKKKIKNHKKENCCTICFTENLHRKFTEFSAGECKEIAGHQLQLFAPFNTDGVLILTILHPWNYNPD